MVQRSDDCSGETLLAPYTGDAAEKDDSRLLLDRC